MGSPRVVDYTLVKALKSSGLSNRKIASILGCASSTVTYVLNKKYRKNTLKRTASDKKKNKAAAAEYKGGKCELCGYNKCIEALEFHHVDETTKNPNFSREVRTSALTQKKKAELDACILVCANCHREIHYND